VTFLKKNHATVDNGYSTPVIRILMIEEPSLFPAKHESQCWRLHFQFQNRRTEP
jgi:hypothetical protein